jgi:hypothetical protein
MLKVTIKTPYYYKRLDESRGIGLFKKKTPLAFPLAKLIFIEGELKGREHYIYNVNSFVDPNGSVKIVNEKSQQLQKFEPLISLKSKFVSRDPTVITYQKGKLIIESSSPHNLTEINGKKIHQNIPKPCPDGSIVTVGDTKFIVHLLYPQKQDDNPGDITNV